MQVTLPGDCQGPMDTKALLYTSISQDTTHKLFFHQQHWKQAYFLMQIPVLNAGKGSEE